MTRIISILFLALFLLAGCDAAEELTHLETAQAQLWEQPKEALSTLQTIDPTRLHSRRAKAQYALLYSQALDRNQIHLTSDSLIRPAAAYFHRHGTPIERIRTYYYAGRIHEHRLDLDSAMILYSRAEALLPADLHDPIAPLIYASLGRMYASPHFTELAIEKHERAAELFLQDSAFKNALYTYWELMDLITYHKPKEQYKLYHDQAYKLFEQAQDSTLFRWFAIREAFFLIDYQKDYRQALQLLQHTIQHHLQGNATVDYLQAIGYSYLKLNQPDSALLYLNKTPTHDSSRAQLQQMYLLSRVYAALGDYKTGYDYKGRALRLSDSIYFAEKRQSVAEVHAGYQKRYLAGQNQQLKRLNHYQLFIALFLFTTILLLFLWRRSQQRKRMSEKEHKIDEYHHLISRLQRAYEELQNNAAATSAMSPEERTILDRHHTFLKELLETTAGYGHSDEPFYLKIEQLITRKATIDLPTGKAGEHELLPLFREMVNAHHPGLIEALLATYPQLTTREIDLYCMIAMDFSKTAICLVLSTSPKTYYNYRNILRGKLQIANQDLSLKAHFKQFAATYRAEKGLSGN